MLFVPFGEPTRSGTTPMTGFEAHQYAERNYSFHTSQGVCAGPPAMVDDFTAVILDRADPKGGWPDKLDPDVQAALDVVPQAVDYGLMGLQIFGSVFSLFPTQTAGHAQLREIILAWTKSDSPSLAAMRERCERLHGLIQDSGWLKSDAYRKSRLIAYNEMYQKCSFGLTGQFPSPTLEEKYENLPRLPEETMEKLRAAFARTFHDLPDGEELFVQLAEWLGRFISFIQVATRTTLETQARINAHLGREQPKTVFMGRDLAKYSGLDKTVDSKHERREPPFLADDIARAMGITIDITVDEVIITEGVREMAPAPREVPLDVPSAG
jgi:hypothetical protein